MAFDLASAQLVADEDTNLGVNPQQAAAVNAANSINPVLNPHLGVSGNGQPSANIREVNMAYKQATGEDFNAPVQPIQPQGVQPVQPPNQNIDPAKAARYMAERQQAIDAAKAQGNMPKPKQKVYGSPVDDSPINGNTSL